MYDLGRKLRVRSRLTAAFTCVFCARLILDENQFNTK